MPIAIHELADVMQSASAPQVIDVRRRSTALRSGLQKNVNLDKTEWSLS